MNYRIARDLTKDNANGTLNRFMRTPYAPAADTDETPWNVYPRPQFKRDSFFCLNGKWALTLLKNGARPGKEEEDIPWGEITVPYPPESELSGVRKTPGTWDALLYQRTFVLPEGFVKDRVLLHFGAVDTLAEVEVNGLPVGGHLGGYNSFSMDITDALDLTPGAEQKIAVRTEDPLDTDLPYGKQRHKRGGMWYTPISGIWQTVWMESVPENAITALRFDPWYDHCTVYVDGGETEKEITIETPDGPVTERFTGNSFLFQPEHFRPWAPTDPYLYYFTLKSGNDTVESYFGLRSVCIGVCDDGIGRIHVNGRRFFFNGVLDQGYYSDGIYLPASPEVYADDIRKMKSLGFNTLRKHIKVEPELFYYECDRLGIFVLQDCVNSGRVSFFRDGLLPTLGFKKGGAEKKIARRRSEYFLDSCLDTMDQLYNHSSVFGYTIFNEGWGQHNTTAIYKQMKEKDPTRVYDAASGWFVPKESDLTSEHRYFGKFKFKYGAKPYFITEFGGYSYNVPGHCFNTKKVYGYQKYTNREEYVAALQKFYKEVLQPESGRGLVGAIYTQLSDVEDETNGLLTYDRAVMKVQPEELFPYGDSLVREISLREQDTELAKNAGDEPGGILLLGDSITDFFPTNVMLKDYRVYNRGFSGNRSDQMLQAMPWATAGLKPEKVFIFIGTNDIGHGYPDDFVIANIRKAKEYIDTHLGNPKMYLVSSLPTNLYAKTEDPRHYDFVIPRPNSKLLPLVDKERALAKELGWTFLDINKDFQDENGNLREEWTVEGLHLNQAGYDQYYKLLKPYLNE